MFGETPGSPRQGGGCRIAGFLWSRAAVWQLCCRGAAGGALQPLNRLSCWTEKLQPNFLHSVFFLPFLLFSLCLPTRSASFLSMLSQTGLAADRLRTRRLGSLHFLASHWESGGHESKYSTVISMQPSVYPRSFLCEAAVKFMGKLHCHSFTILHHSTSSFSKPYMWVSVRAIVDLAGISGRLPDVISAWQLLQTSAPTTRLTREFPTWLNLEMLIKKTTYPKPIYGIIVEYYTCMPMYRLSRLLEKLNESTTQCWHELAETILPLCTALYASF